ncbi:MAG TPA: tRNA preQ1(34) S-adenosylmethionine ribosyltransferase-isomerase QueA [Thermodesulfobacteriota bacterium]|nr:tRNA preQ1(34) S-adenosylmethionine ribosyltransferase-isomerase QueA [Thermodesulfobacteriota bacterium]
MASLENVLGRIKSMKTSDFDYHLPKELIPFYPLAKREQSRLMVVRRGDGEIGHRRFYQLPGLLKKGDLLVLNDTKVIPARLFGKLSNGDRFEVLLTERVNPRLWKAIMRNPKQGVSVEFDGGLRGRVLKNGKDEWLIEYEVNADDYVEQYGRMPLPPYIEREPEDRDRASYQTVYAEKYGAIAAPTAGLHFTKELIDEIHRSGVEVRYVTLHVGVGTFRPVKTDDISEHKMHPEHREIPEETALAVNKAKSEHRRVVAVGTTVVRTLESAADQTGRVRKENGPTDLFIYPGFRFRVVDALITNFHLPRSTLLMLVSAFAGKELIFKAYEEAKREGYRFLSYGDAMLII